MLHRRRQILLTISVAWLSWLTMMLVHEGGHVLGALCTGGVVRQVVWHPAVLSRTDVEPNPHPLVEVWAGPVVGSLLPLIVAGLAAGARLRVAYLLSAVAGFCLIANGVYVGAGVVDPVGGAGQMIGEGTPRWAMGGFGLAAALGGLWKWHRVSGRLGFGNDPADVDRRHAWGAFLVALAVTACGWVAGSRGV